MPNASDIGVFLIDLDLRICLKFHSAGMATADIDVCLSQLQHMHFQLDYLPYLLGSD